MKLSYTLTLADWKAAIRLHSRQKIGRRIHFFIYNFVIPTLAVFVVGFVIFSYSNGQANIVNDLVIPGAVFVFVAILLSIVRNHNIHKSFRAMFPPSETGPGYCLDIDDERILSTRPGIGEATYYWKGICAFAQDKKITLLYLSEVQFIGIPLYKLSPDQRAELNSLIERNMVRKQK